MNYSPHIWSQLKNLTAREIKQALERDGWLQRKAIGAALVYTHNTRKKRVTIHYHPGKTYGPQTLRDLLNDIGWTEDDLRRLKLIK